MLTVACQLWGDWGKPYQAEYVLNLKAGVEKHLTLPHKFVCMTNISLPASIETVPVNIPAWRWNLRKMALYQPDNGLEGRVLALDLDLAITGSLDDIASYDGRFGVMEDFYEPGKAGGCITAFEAGTLEEELYWPVWVNHWKVSRLTHGSERKWYRVAMPDADLLQTMYPGQIVTYKPTPNTRLEAVPEDARIVCFHGQPRPHDVEVEWLKQYWRI